MSLKHFPHTRKTNMISWRLIYIWECKIGWKGIRKGRGWGGSMGVGDWSSFTISTSCINSFLKTKVRFIRALTGKTNSFLRTACSGGTTTAFLRSQLDKKLKFFGEFSSCKTQKNLRHLFVNRSHLRFVGKPLSLAYHLKSLQAAKLQL